MDAADSLRAEIEEREIEQVEIKREGTDLYREIDRLVRAFADKHKCDATSALDIIDTEITYLVDDATGPSWRKQCSLENALSELEDVS